MIKYKDGTVVGKIQDYKSPEPANVHPEIGKEAPWCYLNDVVGITIEHVYGDSLPYAKKMLMGFCAKLVMKDGTVYILHNVKPENVKSVEIKT